MAVHDKYRKDHVSGNKCNVIHLRFLFTELLRYFQQIKDAHTDNTEGVIQEQEEECKEYFHQIQLAIKHGRKLEDVPKPGADCEVQQNIICAMEYLAFFFIKMIFTEEAKKI